MTNKKIRKQFCIEKGYVSINPEKTELYDYIRYLEDKIIKLSQPADVTQAKGLKSAEEYYPIWRKRQVDKNLPYRQEWRFSEFINDKFDFAESYHQHRVNSESDSELVPSSCDWCDNKLCDSQKFNSTCFNCGKSPYSKQNDS